MRKDGIIVHAIVKSTAQPGAQLVQTEPQPPGEGEALVKVTATSICGTDVHIYTWDPWAQSRVRVPLILGHEQAGIVEEVGPGVARVAPGDHVSAETHIYCGRCYLCETGKPHICQNLEILGLDRDGSFAEYLTVPERVLWKNDPTLPPAIASIQEPFGNSVHVAMAGEVPTKTVAILGDGPTGLLAAGVCRALGAFRVWLVGLLDYRLEVARRLGAHGTINARSEDAVAQVMGWTDDLGPDVVLEMSGSEAALRQAIAMVRPGGRIIAFGIPSHSPQLDLASVVFKEVELIGVVGRLIFETWHQAARLLPLVDVAAVITDELPLRDWEHGMKRMVDREAIKVILYPDR